MFARPMIPFHRRATPRRSWLVGACMAWLLAVQTLVLVHGIVHGPLHAIGDRLQTSNASACDDASTDSTRAASHALFGDHTEADCRWFDQHARLDLATVASPDWAPLRGSQHWVPRTQATPSHAQALAPRARDPPLNLS